MEDNMKLSTPEDDEDLEALRLAALQSLKRKANNEMQPLGQYVQEKNYFNGSPHGKQKRKPYSRSAQTRTSRNGVFNAWVRNSNLIAVPMVNEESKSKEEDEVPKLVLPQHRYCKVNKSPEKQETQSSKFDRYDNSDQSDDESEEDSSKSDEEKELKRANSLEELMAELENEIQGVSSKAEEKSKPKLKKKRKISIVEEAKPETKIESTVLKENLKPESETKKPLHFRQRKWQKPRRHNHNPPPNYLPPIPLPEIIQPMVAFAPPPVQAFPAFNPIAYNSVIYTPPLYEAPPPPMMPIHMVPPTYERSRSPIGIADSFGSAPLSPRSAAFVMQNRAIIEKRKRRSYSRSRSPSPERSRRSKSPRRLSLSPERVVKLPRRRSFSPSPIRKVLPPKNTSSSPKKPTIHERLGAKPKEEEAKVKNDKKEDLDPVLEARRKKFERNEITMTEGVIKLKKAEEAEEKKNEEVDEDALFVEEDEVELLDPKLDSLFSDEESDSDNEGRFKTKQETNQSGQKVAVLPFTKLLNGVKTEVKDGLKVEEQKRTSRRTRNERRKRFRSRSPKKVAKKSAEKPKTLTFPNDRKIEIKIRNPAKYEKVEDEKSRKVEVGKAEAEPSVGEEKEDANVSEGDLRAQLSRKRAERQKHPLSDAVPTRLLQNALQGAGVKKLKGKKAKAKDENSEGKLPIRLRLGTTPEGVGKKSRKQKNKGSEEQV